MRCAPTYSVGEITYISFFLIGCSTLSPAFSLALLCGHCYDWFIQALASLERAGSAFITALGIQNTYLKKSNAFVK